jgi:hypothetical protein
MFAVELVTVDRRKLRKVGSDVYWLVLSLILGYELFMFLNPLFVFIVKAYTTSYIHVPHVDQWLFVITLFELKFSKNNRTGITRLDLLLVIVNEVQNFCQSCRSVNVSKSLPFLLSFDLKKHIIVCL